MTIVSEIITDAYRENNTIPIGQSPSYEEQIEGLRIFNRFLWSVLGNELGDGFLTITVGRNGIVQPGYDGVYNGWYPLGSTRFIFNNEKAESINLNPKPQDGERIAVRDASGNLATYPVTINGNGRTIGGQSQVVLNTTGLTAQYFYRDDIGDWQLVSSLQLDSTFPFPPEFEDFFIIGTSLRISPKNGSTLDPQSLEAYRRAKKQFTARYSPKLEQATEEALLRTTSVRGRRTNRYSSVQRFNTGF